MSDARCPSCNSPDLLPFYEAQSVPVHSVLLMPTRDQAVGYRTGTISLEFCPTCGFVTNTAFDPSVEEYSVRYEETQGFSPSFNAFLNSLAARMIDQYGIRNKQVLEIGCGKGEFLVAMCELGDNRGIGIDPSYVPGRTSSSAAWRIRFIQDFYSQRYADLSGDFVCCRHTLEHISPTRQFLQIVRRSIGDRKDTLVFFELPDVLRILREGAFWDVYYEHCSYFSPGSLARLFRSAGFELLELSLAYDDQYILLVARPGESAKGRFDLEDDLDDLRAAVAGFGPASRRNIHNWRRRVQEIAASGQKAVVWGSGSKGVAFLTTLGPTSQIQYVVDINPHRHGKFMPGTGQEIVSPDFLAGYRPDHVVVMNPIYCQEIRRELDRIGIHPELLPLQAQSAGSKECRQ